MYESRGHVVDPVFSDDVSLGAVVASAIEGVDHVEKKKKSRAKARNRQAREAVQFQAGEREGL